MRRLAYFLLRVTFFLALLGVTTYVNQTWPQYSRWVWTFYAVAIAVTATVGVVQYTRRRRRARGNS